MAESTKRSSTARPKRASSRSKPASSRSKPASSRSSVSKSPSSKRSSSRANSTASRNSRSSSSPASRSTSSNGSDGVVHNVADTVGSVASKAKSPLVAGGAAAAGLLGGLVLGSRVLTPRRKVLGVPISRRGFDMKPVAKEVHKAGKQLGRLTDEISQARKRAQKVGDALS